MLSVNAAVLIFQGVLNKHKKADCWIKIIGCVANEFWDEIDAGGLHIVGREESEGSETGGEWFRVRCCLVFYSHPQVPGATELKYRRLNRATVAH